MFQLRWKITFNETKARDRLAQKAASKLRDASRFFLRLAWELAPFKTGFLRESIKLIPGRGKALSVSLRVDAFYAMYKEFGFTHHITGQWIPPKPFIRPAAAATREKYPFFNITVIPVKNFKGFTRPKKAGRPTSR